MAKPNIVIGKVKYPMTQTVKMLEKIGKMWRKNARISLQKQGKVNTGALYNSMPITIGQNQYAFYVDITPKVNYWEFVDKGVQGASRNIFPGQSLSPFKYGSGNGGRGLRGAIDKWVPQKGFQFSDKKTGRFMSYKSTAFLVSRAIWNRGLKPTFFLSGTLKRLKPKAMKWLGISLNKDLASAIKKSLTSNENIVAK